MKTNFLLVFVFIISSSTLVQATHNRAGEIIYQQTGPLEITATIRTYTKASSRPADRDSLEICWGDGTCNWVVRVNGLDQDPRNGFPDGILLGNNIKFNEYTLVHTYTIGGQYVLSMIDPNRNGGILNVNAPNSEQVPFALKTLAWVSETETNNSPIPTLPPIDNGFVGLPFFHTPNAYDPDGDSLSYELIIPLQDDGLNVPNYQFPNQILPGPDNNISIDEETGLFTWANPQLEGEYNIAILIKEYRNGNLIGEQVRDVQFTINPFMGVQLPELTDPQVQIIIQSGETLDVSYQVTSDRPVRIFAYGEPFILSTSPATFTTDTAFAMNGSTSSTLRWEILPDHIRETPYRVALKAETIDRLVYIQIVEIRSDGLVNIIKSPYLPAKITTYPNPGQESFKVKLQESRLIQDGHLRLFDTQGRMLYEQSIKRGNTTWEVPATRLAPGTYYLRLTSPGLMLEEKVVKQ